MTVRGHDTPSPTSCNNKVYGSKSICPVINDLHFRLSVTQATTPHHPHLARPVGAAPAPTAASARRKSAAAAKAHEPRAAAAAAAAEPAARWTFTAKL